ncbi:hypothetical protein Ssi03_51070 [Sphaerisporangium siamense]|uniref:Uncharacterized protein n=1 Tax=Sphaerisporangium siamense TaxID=795645 RepID=A0A7W7GB88_9ACTN|nr:hypothetical protein [Sphaerisporangium siamense]MBB4702189.1 hypothetical protein [Sphaerisporangium siamense]GII87117.1 hypothetical protein Ssi03_51070 [Sphaerisporangium siamense]
MTATLEGRHGTWRAEHVLPRDDGGFDVVVSYRSRRGTCYSAYRWAPGRWSALAEGWALRAVAAHEAPVVDAGSRLGAGHPLLVLLADALAEHLLAEHRLVAQGGGR